LQYAQSYAECHQMTVVVTFNCNSETYKISDAAGTALTNPISKYPYEITLSTQAGTDQVDLASADFGGSLAVSFDSTGAIGSDGTITLVSGARTCKVYLVKATGRIMVSD